MIKSKIQRVVEILRVGGVAAIPTETAYGLAADAMNAVAIKKIFLIKGRPISKPLPLIAASSAMVKKFFFLNKRELVLAKRYWPGPLTLLLRLKKKFPRVLVLGRKKLAVRVSSSKIAMTLSRALKSPIIATSANLSGKSECYSASAVRKAFSSRWHKPDMILEGGRIPKRKPSTVIEVSGGKIKVLRQGQIKFRN